MKNEISAAGNLIQIISQSRQNALKKVNSLRLSAENLEIVANAN